MVKSRAKKKAVRCLAVKEGISYAKALEKHTNLDKPEATFHLIYGFAGTGKTSAAEKFERSRFPEVQILDEYREYSKAAPGGEYYVVLHANDDREYAISRLSELMSIYNHELKYTVSTTTLCYRYIDKEGRHVFATRVTLPGEIMAVVE